VCRLIMSCEFDDIVSKLSTGEGGRKRAARAHSRALQVPFVCLTTLFLSLICDNCARYCKKPCTRACDVMSLAAVCLTHHAVSSLDSQALHQCACTSPTMHLQQQPCIVTAALKHELRECVMPFYIIPISSILAQQ